MKAIIEETQDSKDKFLASVVSKYMVVENGNIVVKNQENEESAKNGFTPYIKASELFRMYQSFKRDSGLLCGDHENASQLGKWLAGIKETKDFLIEKRPGNVKHYAFHLAKLKKNYNVVLENECLINL